MFKLNLGFHNTTQIWKIDGTKENAHIQTDTLTDNKKSEPFPTDEFFCVLFLLPRAETERHGVQTGNIHNLPAHRKVV